MILRFNELTVTYGTANLFNFLTLPYYRTLILWLDYNFAMK